MTTRALPGAGADGGWANFQNLRNGPTRVLVHAKSSLASSAADEQELRAIQPGLDLDDQRALVIARRQDIVCTLAPVEDAYVDFLEAIGVGPGRGRIVTPAAEPAAAGLPLPERLTADLDTLRWIASLVAADEPVVLEPYIASDAEFALAQALGTALRRDVPVSGGGADVVARANAKHEVRALAEALAIPIADGEIVSLEGRDGGAKFDATPLGPALEHRLRATGRVVLRGSSGAGGSSVRVVERTAESVRAALDWAAGRTHDPIYLVEVMLPVTVSPNIQMSVDEGGLHCVGITDQRLSGNLLHQGSVYPTEARTAERMLADCRVLAERLRGEGFTGLIGLDFCEYEDARSGRPEFFLAEINPRINGSTYPLGLASLLDPDHAEIGGFVCGRVRPAARSFTELADRHRDLLLNGRSRLGALPYNVGYLPRGSCHLVVFGHTRADALARWQRTCAAFAA